MITPSRHRITRPLCHPSPNRVFAPTVRASRAAIAKINDRIVDTTYNYNIRLSKLASRTIAGLVGGLIGAALVPAHFIAVAAVGAAVGLMWGLHASKALLFTGVYDIFDAMLRVPKEQRVAFSNIAPEVVRLFNNYEKSQFDFRFRTSERINMMTASLASELPFDPNFAFWNSPDHVFFKGIDGRYIGIVRAETSGAFVVLPHETLACLCRILERDLKVVTEGYPRLQTLAKRLQNKPTAADLDEFITLYRPWAASFQRQNFTNLFEANQLNTAHDGEHPAIFRIDFMDYPFSHVDAAIYNAVMNKLKGCSGEAMIEAGKRVEGLLEARYNSYLAIADEMHEEWVFDKRRQDPATASKVWNFQWYLQETPDAMKRFEAWQAAANVEFTRSLEA